MAQISHVGDIEEFIATQQIIKTNKEGTRTRVKEPLNVPVIYRERRAYEIDKAERGSHYLKLQ